MGLSRLVTFRNTNLQERWAFGYGRGEVGCSPPRT